MKPGLNDQRQLNAAEGWLGLGDWVQASKELELITPEMRAHPAVLRVSWGIYAKAEKWELAAEVAQGITVILPDNSWGYIHFAYSLHELKRTREARAVLLPVAGKFPDQYIIQYNLACYCCQLGELKDGLRWLGKAIDVAGKQHIRIMALEDPDLEPLWKQISEI
jgi:predicted Zn-dependent protease